MHFFSTMYASSKESYYMNRIDVISLLQDRETSSTGEAKLGNYLQELWSNDFSLMKNDNT